MELRLLDRPLTVCKVADVSALDLHLPFYFIGRTDEEISLVCDTDLVPAETTAREDGWRGFQIAGVLDFSLIGILSGISAVLAEAKIGIFAVSTYNTDYILVKEAQLTDAVQALRNAGYAVG